MLGLPPRVLGDSCTDRKHAYTLCYQDRRLDQEERRKPSQNSSCIDYSLTCSSVHIRCVTHSDLMAFDARTLDSGESRQGQDLSSNEICGRRVN